MSDLTATNCGCNNNSSIGSNFIWIILLLCLIGDNGGGCGNNSGFGNILGGSNGNNSSCDMLVLILLMSCMCGGNGGGCC